MSHMVPTDATRLQQALTELRNEVHELRMVIIGNAKYEQEGLVRMVHRHEKFISALTSKWSVLAYVSAGAWAVWSTFHFGVAK